MPGESRKRQHEHACTVDALRRNMLRQAAEAAQYWEQDMRRIQRGAKTGKGTSGKALEAALMLMEMPGKSNQKRQELIRRILANGEPSRAVAS